MEQEKKESSKQSAVTKHEPTKGSSYLNLSRIRELEDVVEAFKDSTLASQFIEKQYPRGEDGNIDTSAVPTEYFNKADMVMCLALGEELGISPVVALSYGKGLNLKSVKKIEKGKKLGIDYATALEQVYIWGEGSKEIIYTSIHIVNTSLTNAGVSREIIQDGTKPVIYCRDLITSNIIPFNPEIHKDIIISNLKKNEQDEVLKALKDNGYVGVTKFNTPIYTAEVKLTRYNRISKKEESISIPYSSQQAIDAGLLKGVKTDGTESKGKDNWNAHPSTHLLKMSIMIGGRIIAADILNGVYTPDELQFVKEKLSTDDASFEDAHIVED